MKRIIFYTAVIAIISVSCQTGQKEPQQTDKPQTQAPAQKKEQKEEKQTDPNTVVLSSNDQMQFDKKEIRVKAGRKVKLTLKHVGEMSIEVMGHNFVLLDQGVDIPTFGEKANEAGLENDHIPQNNEQVIAYTKMIGGGESVTIEFDPPEKGTYDFICSFPGHYAIMQGKFIVE